MQITCKMTVFYLFFLLQLQGLKISVLEETLFNTLMLSAMETRSVLTNVCWTAALLVTMARTLD